MEIDIITSGDDYPTPTEVEQRIENILDSENAVRVGPGEPTHGFHIVLADDWAGLAVEPDP